MKPIYKPKGAAAEYGDYAVNIYTGCPHRCYYCFAPQVLHREREVFHSCVEPRKDIVQEVRRQLEREQITGQLIHLCFACDPYPVGYDSTATREVNANSIIGANRQLIKKPVHMLARENALFVVRASTVKQTDIVNIIHIAGKEIGVPHIVVNVDR